MALGVNNFWQNYTDNFSSVLHSISALYLVHAGLLGVIFNLIVIVVYIK